MDAKKFRGATPSNLDEAIRNALIVGPMREIPERSYHVLKDFMAQKFGAAYLLADGNPQALAILETLFSQLTNRQK